MTLPTSHALGVRRLIKGANDAHGNPAKTYAAATPWLVSGIAPGASVMPGDPQRDLSMVLWTVFAPLSPQAPTDLDLVVFDGVEYALAGHPADWTKGPWPHPTAGVVVMLKRAEG